MSIRHQCLFSVFYFRLNYLAKIIWPSKISHSPISWSFNTVIFSKRRKINTLNAERPRLAINQAKSLINFILKLKSHYK